MIGPEAERRESACARERMRMKCASVGVGERVRPLAHIASGGEVEGEDRPQRRACGQSQQELAHGLAEPRVHEVCANAAKRTMCREPIRSKWCARRVTLVRCTRVSAA